jgi:hypothetical protein
MQETSSPENILPYKLKLSYKKQKMSIQAFNEGGAKALAFQSGFGLLF